MPISKFNKVKISGIVICVPENSRNIGDNVDLLYNGDTKQVNRIKKSIGLGKRHIVKDKTTTSDLCEVGANKLLNDTTNNKSKYLQQRVANITSSVRV